MPCFVPEESCRAGPSDPPTWSAGGPRLPAHHLSQYPWQEGEIVLTSGDAVLDSTRIRSTGNAPSLRIARLCSLKKVPVTGCFKLREGKARCGLLPEDAAGFPARDAAIDGNSARWTWALSPCPGRRRRPSAAVPAGLRNRSRRRPSGTT